MLARRLTIHPLPTPLCFRQTSSPRLVLSSTCLHSTWASFEVAYDKSGVYWDPNSGSCCNLLNMTIVHKLCLGLLVYCVQISQRVDIMRVVM